MGEGDGRPEIVNSGSEGQREGHLWRQASSRRGNHDGDIAGAKGLYSANGNLRGT